MSALAQKAHPIKGKSRGSKVLRTQVFAPVPPFQKMVVGVSRDQAATSTPFGEGSQSLSNSSGSGPAKAVQTPGWKAFQIHSAR